MAGMKRLPFIIAVVVVIVAYVFVWNTKEPVQPSATNTEATKPEKETGEEASKPDPTKAKATAGGKL